MKKVDLHSIIQQNPNAIFQKIEGQITLLDPEREEIYTLNETATFIWEAAVKPVSLQEITGKLKNEFDVSLKTLGKDVLEFVENYLKLGLLISAESSPGPKNRIQKK